MRAFVDMASWHDFEYRRKWLDWSVNIVRSVIFLVFQFFECFSHAIRKGNGIANTVPLPKRSRIRSASPIVRKNMEYGTKYE